MKGLGASQNLLVDTILDEESRSIRARKVVQIGRAEFELLAALAQHTGHLLSREYLLNLRHGTTADGGQRALCVRISRVRQALKKAGSDWRILNQYDEGYRIERSFLGSPHFPDRKAGTKTCLN